MKHLNVPTMIDPLTTILIAKKTQGFESATPVNSSDWGVNSSLTPKLKAYKEAKTRFNMNQAAEPEDAHGDFVSVLDEERAMDEMGMGMVHMLRENHKGIQQIQVIIIRQWVCLKVIMKIILKLRC